MRAFPLAGLLAAALGGAAAAQSACGTGSSTAFRQNAMQSTIPYNPPASDLAIPPMIADTPSAPVAPRPAPSVPPSGPSAPTGPSTPTFQANTAFPPVALSSGGSSTPTAGTVFQDNFANGIDQSKWGFNYPWSDMCDTNGNTDATQYAGYVSPNCPSQAGAGVFSTGAGGLDIAIKPTPAGVDSAGKPYVSGQLYSKQAFNPGTYIEMTAKLPTGSGLGGAFWLIPKSGAWPPEIDVMESQGENPNSVTQTIHDKMPDGSISNQQIAANVPGSQSGFHTYGADFETDKITFYTDGKATGSFATPANFQQGMYAILSTNASPPGSQNWHGTVAPGTPATDFQIQNVRVLNHVPY